MNSCTKEETLLSKFELILQVLQTTMTILEETSRTIKLWLQYFRQVSIMHDFMKSELTGNGNVHLFAVQCMLCHLHAVGHFHYAKATYLRMQSMFQLKTALSAKEFERSVDKDFFTIHRLDKFWCGVWSDVTIEQVLMRVMKVSGGLNQGRKISDVLLEHWISTMLGSLKVTEAPESFTEVTSEYSDKHISLSRSWQKRNSSDLKKFVDWFLPSTNPQNLPRCHK